MVQDAEGKAAISIAASGSGASCPGSATFSLPLFLMIKRLIMLDRLQVKCVRFHSVLPVVAFADKDERVQVWDYECDEV